MPAVGVRRELSYAGVDATSSFGLGPAVLLQWRQPVMMLIELTLASDSTFCFFAVPLKATTSLELLQANSTCR